ncbi:hypothetical protein H9P43_009525 [Blastocladiella emersonii ATCC 22665]|nr:hypothetical protein H9P43_009525 [Blastocladiella emersonii ATCC 22665]
MPFDYKKAITVVAFGQAMSLLVSGSQLFNTGLNQWANTSDPPFYLAFSQLSIHYMFLFAVFAVLHVVNGARERSSGVAPADRKWDIVSNLPRVWWVYLVFSVFDFYANYAVTKAYAFTSPLSAFLLNTSSTPFTVLISMVVFKARYTRTHYGALVLAVAGLGIVIWQDVTATSRLTLEPSDPGRVIIGNILGLASGLGFALSNLTQEWAVKRLNGPNELCLMVGFFGTVVSALHMALFEREEVTFLLNASPAVVSGLAWTTAGFVACMFILYTTAPYFFRIGSATLFNVSLLTSDFWVLLGSTVVLRAASITGWYLLGFACTVTGLFVFNFDPKGWRDIFTAAGATGSEATLVTSIPVEETPEERHKRQ